MLTILGSRSTDGISRRAMLRVGSLGLGALATAATFSPRSAHAAPTQIPTFCRAKRVILLYLYGAAAQHETWDPKPDAPLEIRGKFNPISTAVPGVQICEHLPRSLRSRTGWRSCDRCRI